MEDNTAKNYHTENAVLLSTNFGTDQHKKDMKFISDLHKKDGYLTHQNSLAKYYIVKDIAIDLINVILVILVITDIIIVFLNFILLMVIIIL